MQNIACSSQMLSLKWQVLVSFLSFLKNKLFLKDCLTFNSLLNESQRVNAFKKCKILDFQAKWQLLLSFLSFLKENLFLKDCFTLFF